jgi:hypothetical protein
MRTRVRAIQGRLRAAELCGLAVRGQDGLPDLMLDSQDRGRVARERGGLTS